MNADDVILAAFSDELEKIAGKPSYIRKILAGGKRVPGYNGPAETSRYIRGLTEKQRSGQEVGRLLREPSLYRKGLMRASRKAGEGKELEGRALREMEEARRTGESILPHTKSSPGGTFAIRRYKNDKMREAKKALLKAENLSMVGRSPEQLAKQG